MSGLEKTTLLALKATAIASAAYLDACDSGGCSGALSPEYYRLCGDLLTKIFTLVDAESHFPDLLRNSPAAREIAEGVWLTRLIEEHKLDYSH